MPEIHDGEPETAVVTVPGSERQYILTCPRCHDAASIGVEHESMYSFACGCGGGRVDLTWGENSVTGIRWAKPSPMTGTRPAPWAGY